MIRFLIQLFIAATLAAPMAAKGLPADPDRQDRGWPALMSLSPFERAVRCIKYYEGWHTEKDHPYIGYGHLLRPGENLTSSLTLAQADSLLRSDLLEYCRLFRSYGRDSLLLAALSYNVGPAKVTGGGAYPKSRLLSMIESGERSIHAEYVNFSFWRGKSVASIRRRRLSELRLLFTP